MYQNPLFCLYDELKVFGGWNSPGFFSKHELQELELILEAAVMARLVLYQTLLLNLQLARRGLPETNLSQKFEDIEG